MSVAGPWPFGAVAGDVIGQARINSTTWWFGYLACVGLAVVLAALSMTSVNLLFAPASVIVMVGVVVCVARPRWGVYLAVALAMLGDAAIWPSYPFTKNLSSSESILYLADGVSVSPLELFIAALFLGWILQMLSTRTWVLYRSDLFRPIALFTAFLFAGVLWGFARGGDRLVAYWEIRAILYLPALFVLVTNLLERTEQYRRLLWLVMVVLTVNALAALREYFSLTALEREGLKSLGEHGAAVHAAALIVFTVATWLFRHRGSSGRWVLVVMAVPVGWAFLLSERRAGMVALFAGIGLVFVVLRWHERMRFRMVVPVVVLITAGYLGVFWNASGVPGFPAQAVKTVVAPDQQNEEDQASDRYRDIETHNIVETIKSNPVLGVGFGQKFHMPWPLPNISFFVFWEYITHNSILWIWMKAGIGGFAAMLWTFATALRKGARELRAAAEGATRALTLASTGYVLMFAVFAYVDIAWDTRNVVLLAVCLSQIERAGDRLRDEPPEPPKRRRKPVTLDSEMAGETPVAMAS